MLIFFMMLSLLLNTEIFASDLELQISFCIGQNFIDLEAESSNDFEMDEITRNETKICELTKQIDQMESLLKSMTPEQLAAIRKRQDNQ